MCVFSRKMLSTPSDTTRSEAFTQPAHERTRIRSEATPRPHLPPPPFDARGAWEGLSHPSLPATPPAPEPCFAPPAESKTLNCRLVLPHARRQPWLRRLQKPERAPFLSGPRARAPILQFYQPHREKREMQSTKKGGVKSCPSHLSR